MGQWQRLVFGYELEKSPYVRLFLLHLYALLPAMRSLNILI
jgi:hypothetical protein